MADEKTDDKIESGDHFKVFSKPRGEKHDIYLSDGVADDSADYTDLLHFLNDKVNAEDAVYLHLANMGGSIHSGIMLAHAIKSCVATTLISVEAPCYSMGAIIALSGDAMMMKPGTFLMFHNYSGFSYGKGGESKDALENTCKHMLASDMYFCYPFLSKKEIAGIQKDQDIYIHSHNTDIKARLKRHFKKMQFK